MNNIPPWGDSRDNPWKEFDLFEEWVATKKLKHINISDSRVLIELWELCSDVFMHEREEQPVYPDIPTVGFDVDGFRDYLKSESLE